MNRRYAPVAQLDRAMGFYPTGRGFESLRVYQYNCLSLSGAILLATLGGVKSPILYGRGESRLWRDARQPTLENLFSKM